MYDIICIKKLDTSFRKNIRTYHFFSAQIGCQLKKAVG